MRGVGSDCHEAHQAARVTLPDESPPGSQYDPWMPGSGSFPDLDDEVTRLAILAVVRRAWGHPHLVAVTLDAKEWCMGSVPHDCEPLWWSKGEPSEIAAFARALEAAP
jgi:hypothetical protein